MAALLFWMVVAAVFAASVFCSVTVSALFFHSPSRLEESARDGAYGAELAAHLPRVERYLFSAIVINTTSDLLLVFASSMPAFRAAYREAALEGHPPELRGAYLTFVVALVVVLVFAEVLPRAVAEAYADRIMPRVLPWIARIDRALWPVLYPLHSLRSAISGLVAGPATKDRIADEIRSATLEGEREGVLDEEDASMIESIMEFREAEVREIMTPRTDMCSLEIDANMQDAVQLVVERGHSRIPVYEESRDRIVGVLYAKDILRRTRVTPEGLLLDVDLRSLVRPPFFVPLTKAVADLLKEFRQRKVHLAIVLDEYGGTAGIVTIEDVIEEIVGEIEDEYDTDAPPIHRIDAATAEVDAKLHIDELNKELGLALPEDSEYETLGGFVMHALGKVPALGEAFCHEDVRFTVLHGDERRVNRVRVEQLSGQLA